MKTKMLTALLSSLFLAILACPVLAAPIDMLVAGYGLDASAIPTTFDAETVLGWWLSDGFVTHPLGALFVFLLALCACALIAYSSALKSRAEDGGVLGDAHVKTGREVVKGSMTWGGSTNPSSRGFVYGFTKYRGKPCYFYEPKKMIFVSGATGSGKSRFLYLPSIDLLSYGDASNGSEPATLVVSDVKNELIELTGDELARRGYRVLLLDTQHPYRGQRFNPLKQVLDLHAEGRDQEAEQAADAIAELVVQDDEKGKGSHWTASARGLLSALVLLVSMSDECPEGSRHLATVCEVLDRGTEAEGDDPAEPLKAVFRSAVRLLGRQRAQEHPLDAQGGTPPVLVRAGRMDDLWLRHRPANGAHGEECRLPPRARRGLPLQLHSGDIPLAALGFGPGGRGRERRKTPPPRADTRRRVGQPPPRRVPARPPQSGAQLRHVLGRRDAGRIPAQ